MSRLVLRFDVAGLTPEQAADTAAQLAWTAMVERGRPWVNGMAVLRESWAWSA